MNTQHLRELADKLDHDAAEGRMDTRYGPQDGGFTAQELRWREAAAVIRDCASRIDATLTPGVVDKVCAVMCEQATGEKWPSNLDTADQANCKTTTLAALESVWPVCSEDAKDATAVIVGERIVISVSLDALATAVGATPALEDYDEETNDFAPPIVTDKQAWAREVVRQLNREQEDGTTPIHLMFDAAFVEAIEQGAEGVLLREDDGYKDAAMKEPKG